MELVNRTGYAAAVFRQYDAAGGLDVITAVRGTFDVAPGGLLRLAAVQEPFRWADGYDGDPHAGPLVRQGDLVPYKPGTDVTVLADACCPGPETAAGAGHWRCGFQISDASGAIRLEKLVRVTGPREWRPRWRETWRDKVGLGSEPVFEGWELSEPEPAARVPLDWRLARGGALPDGPPGAMHRDNPLGIGVVGAATAPDRSWPAPQIEAHDAPMTDWRDDPAPAGLGPIPPWWRPRQRHAGTYDAAWLERRHPLLPQDFDDRFWQCAPPDQVAAPWLRGAERFVLLNLHPAHARLTGSLPGIMLGVALQIPGEETSRAMLNLDGVHFDLRRGLNQAVLTWRVRLPLPEAGGARITLAERVRVAEAAAA